MAPERRLPLRRFSFPAASLSSARPRERVTALRGGAPAEGHGRTPAAVATCNAVGLEENKPYLWIRGYHLGGRSEGIPHLPDGEFLPPIAMTCVERMASERISEAFPERRMIHGRAAILTVPHNGRAACHYCGPCDRGCSTASYFSSLKSTLPAAEATGNLTIQTDSIVHSVIYDAEKGRAVGVRVIDHETRQTESSSWQRATHLQGFGAGFKHALRGPGRWSFWMTAFGETLPRHQNYVELDPDVTDRWGIPMLRFHVDLGPNELAMRKDMT